MADVTASGHRRIASVETLRGLLAERIARRLVAALLIGERDTPSGNIQGGCDKRSDRLHVKSPLFSSEILAAVIIDAAAIPVSTT
jgi:hypothetical protein